LLLNCKSSLMIWEMSLLFKARESQKVVFKNYIKMDFASQTFIEFFISFYEARILNEFYFTIIFLLNSESNSESQLERCPGKSLPFFYLFFFTAAVMNFAGKFNRMLEQRLFWWISGISSKRMVRRIIRSHRLIHLVYYWRGRVAVGTPCILGLVQRQSNWLTSVSLRKIHSRYR